jgi:multidrug efflux pump subunit AcrB/outer membrane protein TolC
MTNIIIIALMVLSLRTLLSIQKEGFPQVSFNTVVIQTFYQGASALDVESSVTIPVEEAIEGVSGVAEVRSSSRENISIVTVEIDDNTSAAGFREILDDINQAIDTIDNFPDGIEGPTTQQVKSTDQPIIEIGITGPLEQVRQFTPTLKRKLKFVTGVAQINQIGLPDQELNIIVDMKKARQFAVDIQTIMHAIQTSNIDGTVGALDTYENKKKVVIYNKEDRYEDILNTVLRMSVDGQGITLRQVASVALQPKETNLTVRTNGAKGSSLQIINKADADIIQTIDGVNEVISKTEIPEGLQVSLLNDKSKFTRERLKLLGSNALFGYGLVLLLLYLVFGFRVAFWTAFGIPFSVFGAILLLPSVDATFNALSIGAFVLVLGMLVDDAIVVTEQISQLRETGMNAKEAAAKGVAMIWKPVLASALTTMIAFSPLAQLGGLPGKFIWVIPVIIVLALIFSLIESFFFLPVHLSHIPNKKQTKSKFILMLEELYRFVLNWTLKLRYFVVIAAIGIVVLAAMTANSGLTKESFPQEGAEQFTIEIDLPPGASLSRAEDELKKAEAVINALPNKELIGYTTRIGSKNLIQTSDRGTLENSGIVIVYLTPFGERTRTAQTIIEELRPNIKAALSKKAHFVADIVRVGPPIGKSFEIQVSSNDDNQRKQKISEIKQYLMLKDGVLDISDDIVNGQNEIILKINKAKVAEAGLTVKDVLTSYRIALNGVVVTNKVGINGTVDYRLRLDQSSRSSVESLSKIQIRNNRGRLINFGRLVSFEEVNAIGEQLHINAIRTNTVYGSVNKDIQPIELLNDSLREAFPSTSAVTIRLEGEEKDNEEIFGSLIIAGLIALLGTFLVISVILDSIFKPLIVMSVVPFGAAGVIFTLFFHSMPISMFSMISLIGLTGIIVNGSILMVYSIGGSPAKDKDEGIKTGAVGRLRPILLTTFTTFFGLIPTAYGAGGYDFFISPMCLTMGWGLLFGTTAVLILVPVLYKLGDDIHVLKSKFGKHGPKILAISLMVAITISPLFSTPLLADEGEKFQLEKTPTLLKNHPRLVESQERFREELAITQAIDTPYDGSFEWTTTSKYSEEYPDPFKGFSQESVQRGLESTLSYKKTLNSGLTVVPRLQMNRFTIDQDSSAQTSAMSNPQSSQFEKTNIIAGIRLSAPIGRNFLNRQHALSKDIRKSTESIKESTQEQIFNELQMKIISAYWEAYHSKKNLEVAEVLLNHAVKIHHLNREKYKLGLILKNEYILSDLNVSAKKSRLINAQSDWRNSLKILNGELGIEHISDIEIVDIQMQIPNKYFTSESITANNPSWKQLELTKKLINDQLSLNSLNKRDPVNLFFDAQTKGSDTEFNDSTQELKDNNHHTYMIGLTWVFQPVQSQNNSELAVLTSRNSQVRSRMNHLSRQLRTLQASTKEHLNRVKRLQVNLTLIKEKREKLVNEQSKEFKLGRITTKDYIESQELLDILTLEEAELVKNWNLTIINYLANIGGIDRYYSLLK